MHADKVSRSPSPALSDHFLLPLLLYRRVLCRHQNSRVHLCLSPVLCRGGGPSGTQFWRERQWKIPPVLEARASPGCGVTGRFGSRPPRREGRRWGPTSPPLFSSETLFPNPSWPVLLLKGVIYHTDNVTLAAQPLEHPPSRRLNQGRCCGMQLLSPGFWRPPST